MARVCITGFTGWGCNGDEGILLAMMDSLGDHDYIVSTSLPAEKLEDYKRKLPTCVVDVRQIYDVRSDYDVFLLGGGGLGWGFGWRQAINAFSHNKPSMLYGVGFNFHELYHPRLDLLYSAELAQFDAITVRDLQSYKFTLEELSYMPKTPVRRTRLTCCPSINLKEQKFDDCPKGMIAVCPRYEDYDSNTPQIDWLVDRLKDVSDEVLLIPFAPYNNEMLGVDMALCLELKSKLKNSHVLHVDGFSPRKIKYAISQSKRVISGGRYHACVWASAHNIPFEYSPTSSNYPKVEGFAEMQKTFGNEKLKEMERVNVKTFKEILVEENE